MAPAAARPQQCPCGKAVKDGEHPHVWPSTCAHLPTPHLLMLHSGSRAGRRLVCAALSTPIPHSSSGGVKHHRKRQKELSFGRKRLKSGSSPSLVSYKPSQGQQEYTCLPAALAITHSSETPVTAWLPGIGGGEMLQRPFSCDSSCKPQVIQLQPQTAPTNVGGRSSSKNTLRVHSATGRSLPGGSPGTPGSSTTFPVVPQPQQHPAGHGLCSFSESGAGSPPNPTTTLPEYSHWQKKVSLASPPRNPRLGLACLLMEGKARTKWRAWLGSSPSSRSTGPGNAEWLPGDMAHLPHRWLGEWKRD